MPKIITLKLNKEFKHAYFQGKYKAHPILITYRVRNRMGKFRIGITTSKKIGCAVMRNRARRIIRQAIFELVKENLFANGYDYVFVARSKTPFVNTAEVKQVMKKQIFKLNKC